MNFAAIKSYLEECTGPVELNHLKKLLNEAPLTRETVSEYVQFSSSAYTRNLVSSSPWFEMLVLCWQGGQSSAIHDHAGSGCAFKIISGTAIEINWRLTGRKHSGLTYVEPVSGKSYPEGSVCASTSSHIHRIVNGTPGELITLHIYSPPLNMNIYEPDPAASPESEYLPEHLHHH